jgi:hypothetical protein
MATVLLSDQSTDPFSGLTGKVQLDCGHSGPYETTNGALKSQNFVL